MLLFLLSSIKKNSSTRFAAVHDFSHSFIRRKIYSYIYIYIHTFMYITCKRRLSGEKSCYGNPRVSFARPTLLIPVYGAHSRELETKASAHWNKYICISKTLKAAQAKENVHICLNKIKKKKQE